MKYISTRDEKKHKTTFLPSQAVIKGIGEDGGLFIPEEMNVKFDMKDYLGKSYSEIAFLVLSNFFDNFTEDELKDAINSAYNKKNFSEDEIFPIKTFGKYSYLELFTGRTCAFKDCALSILPYLMKTSLKKENENKKVLILTATSGDTGKAALEGFAGREGIDISVFYPKGGVSRLQQLQMQTQSQKNTQCFAFEGNFDDCQNTVKEIFTHKEFNKNLEEKGVMLSSANSINIGRLFPQVVYYFHAYSTLVKNNTISKGDKVNFVVPTGNFGNILSGYYAKKMGLPINKLILASNENNVLYDFFKTGVYDKNRPFVRTISPSMDILISSNLERLLFEIVGKDSKKLNLLMKALKENGKYEIELNKEIMDCFDVAYATEDEIRNAIKAEYEKSGYLIDTHTAAAKCGYDKTKDENYHTVILSTASPFKFPMDVYTSVFGLCPRMSEEALMDKLSEMTGIPVPSPLEELKRLPVRPTLTSSKETAREDILSFLEKGGVL